MYCVDNLQEMHYTHTCSSAGCPRHHSNPHEGNARPMARAWRGIRLVPHPPPIRLSTTSLCWCSHVLPEATVHGSLCSAAAFPSTARAHVQTDGTYPLAATWNGSTFTPSFSTRQPCGSTPKGANDIHSDSAIRVCRLWYLPTHAAYGQRGSSGTGQLAAQDVSS